jgi:hypothetical protein
LAADGTLWGWGHNYNAILGPDTNENVTTPRQIAGIDHVNSIEAGLYHIAALKSDGTVWCWGMNDGGECGLGNKDTPITAPAQVKNLSGVIGIACGSFHVFALKNDGTVWAWGSNNSGQLGDLNDNMSTLPVKVNGIDNVTMVVPCHLESSMVIRRDGTVWAWGQNITGQLGIAYDQLNGTDVPRQIPGIANAVYANMGYGFGLAILSDSSLWTWGGNFSGELGDGTNTNRLTPAAVPGLTDVSMVSQSGDSVLALRGDGTVWTWGFQSSNGELGNGSGSSRSTPAKVEKLNGVTYVASGPDGLEIAIVGGPPPFPPPGSAAVTSSAFVDATVGESFSYQITATNNPTSYTADAVPPGVIFDATKGLFSGTPTTVGVYRIAVSVANATRTTRYTLTIVVSPPRPPSITSPLTATTVLGQSFSYAIQATGTGSFTYSASNLPPGLTFSGNTISGKVSVAGITAITLTATGIGGTDTESLLLTITNANGTNDSKPEIASPPEPTAQSQAGETITLAATASDPAGDLLLYKWDFGDGTTGIGQSVTHAYAANGLYTATLTVTDGVNNIQTTVRVAVSHLGLTQRLQIAKAALKFDFKPTKHPNDSLLISGKIPVAWGFDVPDSKAVIMIGDLNREFVMGPDCQAGDDTQNFKITRPLYAGQVIGTYAKFALSIRKQALLDSLKSLGFQNATLTTTLEFPMLLQLGNNAMVSSVQMTYRARAGVSGTAQKTK